MKPGEDAEISATALDFEYELDAPPAKVWRALTIPEYVVQWLQTPEPEGAPPVSLRLLDVELNCSVRYRLYEDQRPDCASIVTFRLTPNDAGGTTFRIVHERIASTRASPTRAAANNNRPRLLRAA